MAETKGITISFYGDTANFDKSVDGINKALKKTQNELKEVNKSLKIDSSNPEKLQRQFELLTQKQSLLQESLKTYREELDKLGDYDSLNEDQKKQWEALQKSIAQAENDLAKVNKQLDYLKGKDLRDLGKQLQDIGKNLDKVGKSIEQIAKKFMVLTGAISGLAISGVKYNAELERQTTLFTTLTGSAEEAERVINGIKLDSLTSPFDTQSLITANQYLLSTGIEAEKTREVINDLGDAISATGGGNSELERMAQNLQQVQNVGKASSVDMKQFAMAGIDIWGILADSTGKTVEQLQKTDITFEMIADALHKASSEGGKYYGAMSAQADTLNGKINKLKATFKELLGELTQVLMPVIKNVLDIFQGWIDKLRSLDNEQKKTITKIAGIVASIGPVLLIIGKLTSEIGGLLIKVGAFVSNPAFISFMAQVTSAGGGLVGVLSTIGAKLVALINPITAVIGAFALLYAKNEDFRKAINNLVSTIKKSLTPIFKLIQNEIKQIIEIIGKVISQLVVSLTPIITRIIEIIVKVITTIGNLITKISGALQPIIKTIISVFTSFVSVIANVVTWLSSKLGPAFEFVVKVMQLAINVVSIFANNVGTVLVTTLNTLVSVVNKVKNAINSLITAIQNLFNKMANTSFGQKFIDMFNKIGNVANGLKDGFSKLTGWLDNLISKTNTVIGKQQTISNQMSKSGRSWSTMASGGLGMNVNINVTNNGTPIDTAVVNSWAETIAQRVDYVLGRNLT